MNANKVIPENLVAVHQLCEINLYKHMDGLITALQTLNCDWFLYKSNDVDFSKLTDINQILRFDFLCIH